MQKLKSGPKISRWWKVLVPICRHCLNYMKFGQLFLRKIIKIVATRCQDFKAKMHQIRFRTKFDFGWGSAPDPAGGAYSDPPDLLAGFNSFAALGDYSRHRSSAVGD